MVNDKVPIENVLKSLESRFKVSFSYLDESVHGIAIDTLLISTSLSEYIAYIEKNTLLKIEQIDGQFYAVQKIDANRLFCGYLVSAQDKTPVSGAFIILGDVSTISSESGRFELEIPSNQEYSLVTIRHVGYETKTERHDSSSGACQTIFLAPFISTLEEVVISNYITQGIERKAGGEYVIRSSELQGLPGLLDSDVLMSLQVLPSIHSVNESVSDINIRGGTNDQNLILWDGVRLYQSGHFFGLISIFNPIFTDHVTVFKNGTQSANGNAVSGTIDIRTNDEVDEKFSASAGLNLLNTDVEFKVPLTNSMSINLAARHSVANLIHTPTYNQYFEKAFGEVENLNYNQVDSLEGGVNDFYYYDLGLKYLWDISSKDHLRISVLNVVNNLSYEEYLVSSNKELTKFSQVQQKSSAAGISYERIWNGNLSTQANGYLSHYQLRSQNNNLLFSQNLNQENLVLDWGVKLDAQWVFNTQFSLSSGYHFTEISATNLDVINNPEFERLVKDVLDNHVWYAEGNYLSDPKKLDFRTGVRMNYYQQLEELVVEPRFSVNYHLSDKLSVYLLGEYKSQASTQIIDLQNDFLGVEKRRWVLSNGQDVPLIKSRQLSLGLQYTIAHFLISVEGYMKYVDGIITSSQAFQNQFELVRSPGNYSSTGLDFLMNYSDEKFSGWLGYNLSRTLNEFDQLLDQEFPGNIDIRHSVSNGYSFATKKMESSIGFNWHTGRPYTAPLPGTPVTDGKINYEFPNSSNLNNYFRLDVSVKYKFDMGKKARGQVGFSVWNLTNYQNTISRYFRVGENQEVEEVNQSGLGITPNIMFRVDFF
ncbi:MAG: TonB-dependent receptor plug domain-containing protein [Reichenbachiella sp.]